MTGSAAVSARLAGALSLLLATGCPTKDNPNYSDTAAGEDSSGADSVSPGATTTTGTSSTTSDTSTSSTTGAPSTGEQPTTPCDEGPDGLCFGEPRVYGGAVEPLSLAVADIDGDSFLDVVVGGDRSRGIQRFLGAGDGTLQELTPVVPVDTNPFDIVLGDVDLDGVLDLVMCASRNVQGGRDSEMVIMYGIGSADPEIVQQDMGEDLRTCALADLDDNGEPDLLLGDRSLSTVRPIVQSGGGFTLLTEFPFGGGPVRMRVADFDGDDLPEVAVTDIGDAGVGIVSFDAAGDVSGIVEVDSGPIAHWGVAVADLDGDNDLDIATTRAEDPGELVLVFSTDGDFSGVEPVILDVLPEPRGVAAGDVNGDQLLDLVVAEQGTVEFPETTLAIFVGEGGGQFAAPVRIDLGVEQRPQDVELADLNQDGNADIVATVDERVFVVLTEPS